MLAYYFRFLMHGMSPNHENIERGNEQVQAIVGYFLLNPGSDWRMATTFRAVVT